MTAATTVRCDYCGTGVPASETFRPYGAAVRCKDTAACERRALRAYDPTILADEDMPVPPATVAPPGTVCGACRTVTPAGLYDRGHGAWFCRDRAACEQASIETTYLTAWSDESPDRLVSAAGMRAAQAAAGAQIPPERTELGPAGMAALAASEALGRKRAGR